MTTTIEEHEAEIATDTITRRSTLHANMVCRQLASVPDVLVTPGLIADVLDALINKAKNLSEKQRELAEGYLIDCRDDMRYYAETT